MDTRKAIIQNFDPLAIHEEVVAVEGLEDLFSWASELVVADGSDPRTRRTKDQRVRRDVLGLIQHSKELEAREKYADEVAYLQRRVIALLQIISEKSEQMSSLKQAVLSQHVTMSQLSALQEELQSLKTLAWHQQEAEAERKHLMDSLTKLKKERDYLDEILTVTENENIRLAKLYRYTSEELTAVKNRKWWHPALELFRSFTNCSAAT